MLRARVRAALGVFDGGHMRAPLDAALANESRRLDLLVTRGAQLLFGCTTLVGVVIAVAVSRTVGFAVGGASALYLLWATVQAWFYSRGVDSPFLRASAAIGAGALPWVFMLGLAATEGADYALASWVPPLFYATMVVSGIVRLRPMVCAVGGVVSGIVYMLLYLFILRARLSAEDAGRALFQPGLQLTRAFVFAISGLLAALLTNGLRSVVARAESAVRQQEVFGKYRLVRFIAAGGMGEVFEALYCPEGGFERRVALKRIHPMHSSDRSFVTRFRAEAELTAHLAHPNIVQVMDFGRMGDAYYLAMEYVDGLTLSAILEHCAGVGRQLGPDFVGYVGREILSALAYAHTARGTDGGPLRVVHCDLCPQNVLLSRAGEVKVIDFGVARALRSSAAAHTRTVRGHLSYLAPETIRNESIDERTDLHAVGLILWELLSGRRVFDVEGEAATLNAVLSHQPSPITAIRTDVDPAWNDFLSRAMAREPVARFASARTMLDALDDIAGTRSDGGAERTSELVEAFRGGAAVTRDATVEDGPTLAVQTRVHM
jgi:eukaryotic-like serine/threonine-protein kinase